MTTYTLRLSLIVLVVLMAGIIALVSSANGYVLSLGRHLEEENENEHEGEEVEGEFFGLVACALAGDDAPFWCTIVIGLWTIITLPFYIIASILDFILGGGGID